MDLIRGVFAQQHSTGKIPVPIGTTPGGQANFGFAYDSLGQFTSFLVPLVFSIAAMLVVFYFLIGAFELITSQGDKAHIVSARSKIYHSIIGFILLMALFLVMQYIVPALVPGTTLEIF